MKTREELDREQASADADYEIGYIGLRHYERILERIEAERRALILEQRQMLRED